MPQLLNNASPGNGPAVRWGGGRGAFSVVANFGGGGSVQLQATGADGASWVNVGAAATANGLSTFELPPGQIRAVVATATSAYADANQTKG